MGVDSSLKDRLVNKNPSDSRGVLLKHTEHMFLILFAVLYLYSSFNDVTQISSS